MLQSPLVAATELHARACAPQREAPAMGSHCDGKPPLAATREEPALCCNEDPAEPKLKKKIFFKGNRISVP